MLPTIRRFLLLACGSMLALQVHAAPADDVPYTVPRSMVETVVTKSSQHYKIMVSWPEGRAPASGWPVMYVLDGSHYFAMATDMLRNQVCAYPCPLEAGVVVAIGYPDRSRREYDFTPKAPPGPPEMRLDGTPYPVVEYGGADAFLDFIESDLKPRIESRFRIDRTRQTLFGHSYGGLFVLHTLYTRPQAFSTYVASSPSIWWNNRYIEKEEQAFTRKVNATALPRETRLLIGVGEGEQTLLQRELRGSPTETGNLEWRRGRRRMVDSTRELAERLEDLSSRNLVAMHRTFDNESHVSVPSVALATAVSMAFGIRPADVK
ncbi:alpha/beta hydrolase [Pigmentiphaga litoralis]|uniref:alpha/beta hydrolase n=1 Tax=Pigmentiphaga litoralis TaxID=516702 RepID=UPI003B42D3A2